MTIETKKRLLISKWHEHQFAGSDSEKYSDMAYERDELAEALERVKYWLHDGLVHGKLVSDPRAILRTIEDVLP